MSSHESCAAADNQAARMIIMRKAELKWNRKT